MIINYIIPMNTSQNNKQTIPCPECDTPLQVPSQLIKGKIIECPACGCESEVVEINPIKISPLEEEK